MVEELPAIKGMKIGLIKIEKARFRSKKIKTPLGEFKLGNYSLNDIKEAYFINGSIILKDLMYYKLEEDKVKPDYITLSILPKFSKRGIDLIIKGLKVKGYNTIKIDYPLPPSNPFFTYYEDKDRFIIPFSVSTVLGVIDIKAEIIERYTWEKFAKTLDIKAFIVEDFKATPALPLEYGPIAFLDFSNDRLLVRYPREPQKFHLYTVEKLKNKVEKGINIRDLGSPNRVLELELKESK